MTLHCKLSTSDSSVTPTLPSLRLSSLTVSYYIAPHFELAPQNHLPYMEIPSQGVMRWRDQSGVDASELHEEHHPKVSFSAQRINLPPMKYSTLHPGRKISSGTAI
jgi:hypothetical protein